MLKALLKLFGCGGSCGCASAGAPKEMSDLTGFVNYVVRQLVDYPDEVKVEAGAGKNDGECVIRISCRKEDIGKIVGKKGKTIMAVRALVSGAAGRLQKRISVEVLD